MTNPAMPPADPLLPTLDEVLARWPLLRSRSALDWAGFAQVLSAKGKAMDAAVLSLAVLDRVDAGEEAATFVRTTLRQWVPTWHWFMVTDTGRNDAYEAAIRGAVTPGDLVLDVGAGSGLLGMMAARAGAGAVYACEMVPLVAAIADRIVRRNGWSDTVRILPRHSGDLVLGTDLPRKADVIVSEIVSNGLLEEEVLATHRDLVPRLLRDGGRVIPGRISVMTALGHDAALEATAMGVTSGFDISPFNAIRPAPLNRRVENPSIALRSTAAPLFTFDLGRPDSWPGAKASVAVEGTGGPANTVLQWIRLDMDPEGSPGLGYENRPGSLPMSCWEVRSYPLARPVVETGGHGFRVAGSRSDQRLWLWLEGGPPPQSP